MHQPSPRTHTPSPSSNAHVQAAKDKQLHGEGAEEVIPSTKGWSYELASTSEATIRCARACGGGG